MRKPNLPATWVIFFNWQISYLSVIGKMHYNQGYGLVAIPRKWPTHKQWNFLVSKNIFFGYNNNTILSMRKTREVVVQKKLQLQWSSKLNYVCWWWGGDRFSVSMLCYLQLVSIFPFLYCTSTHIMSLCLVWKNRKKCQSNKLV